MTQKQKSIHVLTGLGDDVFIGTPEEVTNNRDRTIVQILVKTLKYHDIHLCYDSYWQKASIGDTYRDI